MCSLVSAETRICRLDLFIDTDSGLSVRHVTATIIAWDSMLCTLARVQSVIEGC